MLSWSTQLGAENKVTS